MPESLQAFKPQVIVLYNESPDWPEADLTWSRMMLDMMLTGLREEGYDYQPLRFFDDLSALDRFDPREWLIWNWGEELGGQPWSEAAVAAELERRGFAFTGSASRVIAELQNRFLTKERLRAAGLPTLPARVFRDPAQAAEWQTYPAIVKGNTQHASYGISGDSVVHSPEELGRRIAYLRQHFDDDALVEPFLDSREFQVAVWGNGQPEVLPPVEFDFSMFGDPRERLYTYEAKFDHASRAYNEIKMPCPAPADRPDWRARIEAVAVEAYRAVGLRDYGRFDMRMLGDEPQILDVNPNPDLDPVSVLPVSSHVLGLSFGQMVSRILTLAAERMPR